MIRTPRLWGLVPAVLLGTAALALADDVSLVGDFQLNAGSLAGTLLVGDDLQARLLTPTGEFTGAVTRLSAGFARLELSGLGEFTLTPGSSGGFTVGTSGALRRQRTFPEGDVNRAKEFLQANAKSIDNLDCITTINRAVRILYRDPTVRTGSQQDHTMNGLVTQGLAHAPQVIEFFDANGKKTLGVTEPATLRESVWDALLTQSKGDRGWCVFGLSIMDGYHSVLLFLDATDPSQPRVYWADQWSSKGGFKEYDREGLDSEIQSKTNSWWSEDAKPRARTTIWRLRPHAQGRALVARTRVRLNLRSTPDSSVNDNKVGLSLTTERFLVVDRDGKWRRLLGPDGQTVAWGHSAYMLLERGVPSHHALSMNAGATDGVIQVGLASAVSQN